MSGRKLSGPQAAARAGIKPATWRHYVHKGLAPTPDGREEVSGHPWWWEATVDQWMVSRPGRGGWRKSGESPCSDTT